jgi:hypothetical protein
MESPEQLQQLVAPIALYPDSLVAQILAASTYPTQIVEADRWLQQNPNLKGDQLGQAVDQQSWDPSVKALTAFPSVLANMDKNLSWTSELGDAYVNQQQDVMNAIQVMRQKAEAAGTLTNDLHEKVVTQGQTIVVEPADPEVVYVPAYDPWTVYGAPFGVFPGYYYAPPVGVVFGAAAIGFGIGIGIGAFGHWGWGWHRWGFDWGHRNVVFDRHTYVSHSTTIVNRTTINRNTINRNNFNTRNVTRNNFNHNVTQNNFNRNNSNRGPALNNSAPRGAGQPHGQTGVHSGALSGFDHGGNVRGFSSRGQQSFGGGARAGGGGGGGFHGGGGGHGGGGHR